MRVRRWLIVLVPVVLWLLRGSVALAEDLPNGASDDADVGACAAVQQNPNATKCELIFCDTARALVQANKRQTAAWFVAWAIEGKSNEDIALALSPPRTRYAVSQRIRLNVRDVFGSAPDFAACYDTYAARKQRNQDASPKACQEVFSHAELQAPSESARASVADGRPPVEPSALPTTAPSQVNTPVFDDETLRKLGVKRDGPVLDDETLRKLGVKRDAIRLENVSAPKTRPSAVLPWLNAGGKAEAFVRWMDKNPLPDPSDPQAAEEFGRRIEKLDSLMTPAEKEAQNRHLAEELGARFKKNSAR